MIEPRASHELHPLKFKSRSFRDGAALWLCGVACSAALAYDHSEPMRAVAVLPLGYPESPFVLRFSPEELQAQRRWADRVDAIVISQGAAPAIRTGAAALRTTLRRCGLGEAVIVELYAGEQRLPATMQGKHVIVLGTPENSALAAALCTDAGLEVTDARFNGDGFVIKPVTTGKQKIILVSSPVARGVLYGAYELEERTSRRGVPEIDDEFIPAVRFRAWPMHVFVDEPRDSIGRWRLNVSNANDWGGESAKSLLFYSEFPELGGAQHRERIQQQQEKLHRKYANAVAQGAMPMMTWNPLSFTIVPGSRGHRAARQTMGEAHPGILAKPVSTGLSHMLGTNRQNLCPSHPMTRRFVATAVRELVETFPEIELIQFMLSDSGGELLCGCEKCERYPFLKRVTDYSALIIGTAREVKPGIRFIMCPSALMHFIPAHHREIADEVTALKELEMRLGADVEAFTFSVGTPPGLDSQSWLAPDSAMLGQGVPLVTFLQHYESDGPGIAAPVSNVVSHLSWSLPIHLRTLQRHVAGGMIGAFGQGAGLEVGYWHTDLDGERYMKNWCRAKYGDAVGGHVFRALRDSHKITEAFHLETKRDAIESIDFFRWGEYLGPWAVDMNVLVDAGLTKGEVAGVIGNTVYAFSIPQAPRPAELERVLPDVRDGWLKRFELSEAIAIADKAAKELASAVSKAPRDAEIAHLYAVAQATQALTRLFRDYHVAFVHASAARNTADPVERRLLIESARGSLRSAIEHVVTYRDVFLPRIRAQEATLASLRFHAPVKYVGTFLALVREACFLFDREFDGDGMLEHMDRRMKVPVENSIL